MKKFLILLVTLLSLHTGFAQEKWTIQLNGRTVRRDSVENPEKNIVRVKRSQLKKGKELSVLFSEKNEKKEWDRFLGIYNEGEEELVQKMSTKLKVSNAKLLYWGKTSKRLTIYTWSLPTDPDLRSRIRIRRIHLCTLVIE